MKFPWHVEKKINTPAEKKLKEIENLLFPSFATREELDKSNKPFKYHIDYSIDSNLDAALCDLQEGYNDLQVQKTINNAVKTLYEVRKLLNRYAKLDEDAKYIIVESNTLEDREIEAENEI